MQMASLNRKDQDELHPVIRETVVKRLGFPENAVIKAAISCLSDGLDVSGCVDKMAALLGDDLAPRFVEDLFLNVEKFRKERTDKKRPATVTEALASKKQKLDRLEALIDDDPLPPTIPEPMPVAAPDPLALLNSTSQVSAMVATMKRQIEERKRALMQSGIGSALYVQQQRMQELDDVARLKQYEENEEQRFLHEAAAKAKRAADLKAKIAEKMQGKAGLLASLGSLPIKTGNANEDTIPITAVKPGAVVVDSHGVAIDQTTGRQIQMMQRMPTLKVNIREKKREQLKLEGNKPRESPQELSHFDPRLGNIQAMRQKRNFKFHEAGKFQQLAQRIRAKAQLEKLQKQIQETAKKTGIQSAAKLAAKVKEEEFETKKVPEMEWWDLAICPSRSYIEATKPAGDGEVRLTGISNLVEHPIQKDAPSEPKSTPSLPIFLTKKERKKIRTQRRREQDKEKQEKIRLGLEAPPPPKVKISNLMRVLATEAVQDPTKVEAHVRAQMAARQKAHEAANEERKLTKEQRQAKKFKKLNEDTSLGVHITVFKILDISNPAKRFKVDKNAQQLYMTGCVAIVKDMVIVITEGGPKAQKKFKHLMLSRIKWSEDSAQGHKQDKIDKKNYDTSEKKKNECALLWEGANVKRLFKDWQFQSFASEFLARQHLKQFGAQHYWDLAVSQTLLAETET